MNDLEQVLKKGTLLIIETGEYSGRDWSGPVRLLKTVSKAKLAEDFLAEWTKTEYPDGWRDEAGPEDFVPWLIKTKRAETVDGVHSWHVGSYGQFEP